MKYTFPLPRNSDLLHVHWDPPLLLLIGEKEVNNSSMRSLLSCFILNIVWKFEEILQKVKESYKNSKAPLFWYLFLVRWRAKRIFSNRNYVIGVLFRWI